MSLIGNLSCLGQNASNKMKDTAEIVRISGQIADCEKELKKFYIDIGKSCCAEDWDKVSDMIQVKVQQAKAIQSQLDGLQKQVSVLKGNTTCPNCGAVSKNGTGFCSSCGQRFSITIQKKCLNCGSPLEADQIFCTFCGTLVADVGGNTFVCSRCGKKVESSHTFCKYCGNRIN